jgi:non-canonical poly(A) RNA polymerase PAPD5/7
VILSQDSPIQILIPFYPPLDESQCKKMDVVKLIKKARVVSSSKPATETEAVINDFISFDFNDEGQDSTNKENGIGVPGGPKGPRSHRHPKDIQHLPRPSLTSVNPSRRELNTSSDPALGNRKRNYEDEIKDAPLLPIRPTSSRPVEGSIVKA